MAFRGIKPVNQDDPVIISIIIANFMVSRVLISIIIENFMVSTVLIDRGSFVDILYWKTF